MADQYQSREERRKQQQAKGKPKTKTNKKPKGIIKKIFLTLVALGIVVILAGVGTFAYMVKDAPKLDPKILKDPISSKILDMNGHLLTEVGAVNREYVDYKDIPKLLENAVLATEDYRFYKHHGIDPIRLGGAVLANIKHGFGAEGGSTITQQVIKNSFLTPEKTIKRKVEEAWLSYQLEQKYTKHQIFEMYVNKVNMSEGSYGMATAAETYYGKKLKDLTLPEAALLAGMPQSPNNYNPFTNPDLAEKRRNIVLSLMHQHGFISKQKMEEAMKVPIKKGLVKEDKRKIDEKPFDSFVDAVIDEVKQQGDFDIFSDGLTIYTTVDPKAQKYVYKMLNTQDVINYPDKKFQAGVSLLDTKTGAIRAIGGGRNQQVKRGFNYAIDTRRQPGSTIKPVLDYGPAIEYLKWGTYQTIDDKPVKYSTGQTFGNWDGRYMGRMTIRTALQLSRNTPAVQTLQQVGLDRAKKFANNLGIPLKEIYESYAIGGLRDGVSPLQMAGAYSAFGNNGLYTKPYAVIKIKLRDGTVINTTPETKVVMKDYTAFMITDMLKSVLQYPGTGTRANVPSLHIAGKTGTTNYTDEERAQWNIPSSSYIPDAWFSGYTPNYTASIWTGYKDRSTPIAPGEGQKIAQDMFRNLISYVSEGKQTSDFPVPNSVQRVRIEKGSMPPVLASQYTPSNLVITEYAVKGNAPSRVSTRYDKLNAPGSASVKYDEKNNQLVLKWSYKNKSSANIQFAISVDDGSGQTSLTTDKKSITIPNVTPGATYKFTIAATDGSRKSDLAAASFTVPKAPEETIPGNENNGDNGTENGTTSDTNPGQDTGQDQGTGTGTGTDTGTDTGTEQGQGEGQNQGTGTEQGNDQGNKDQGTGETNTGTTDGGTNKQDTEQPGT
ncbi:PBP1A family penicillin-binding protein [Bacillus salipaludis]|uniref:PBP1A family penicillin-binding protein n=1 Tax=Bacillus salipaludis TaxID=2547811 RepID=UPI002E1FA110|nr:PBP1A family penicillin-binding protein [Bacillus salipaludis]